MEKTDDKIGGAEKDREDRITYLPKNVIDGILELLPVEDAARTSILSEKWRYVWAMLSNLVLDKLFCKKFAVKSEYVFEGTVNKILLQHLGDIVKFGIDISGVHLFQRPDIDTWLLYVTRNGVKDLTLNMSNNISYRLPSYIFNCPTLTNLELFNCVFQPPNSFWGFENLRTLYLETITFVPTIESWVINAPLLGHLALIDCNGTQYLNIVVSSELKYLFVHLSHCNFDLNCFTNCKNLMKFYFVIDNPLPAERPKLENLLFSLPTLEVLTLGSFLLQILSAGVIPKRLPSTLNYLLHLELLVEFSQIGQTSYALELIKSSSNLSKLEIWRYC